MSVRFHSPSAVKIEHDDPDSPFIIELTSSPHPSTTDLRPAPPPTEVPLRATQASKEMRCMMGVFRLNPFAMHSLSRSDDSPDASPTASASWSGEAGPLDQEPVMFEFQLHISGLDSDGDPPVLRPPELPAISAHDESQLRAFSPTFELPDADLSEHTESAPSSSSYHIQHDHPIHQEDPGADFRQVQCDPWEEADYAPHPAGSDSGASSSTTLSIQTPVNEINCSPFDDRSVNHFPGAGPCQDQSPTVDFPSTPLWDVPDNYQSQDGPSLNYGHTDISQRGGIVHSNPSHPYMRISYPPSYTRPYPQPNPQFQQTQTQPSFFHLSMPSPSLIHNTRCSGSNSPNQEIEHVPQSPSTISPLSPATPNGLQYSSLNQQQHGHYQHQMPYSASNPVTPTSMPLRLPISIARSAMRSAAAFSNAASPTSSCQSQLPPPSPYSMHSNGRGYRLSRRPQLEERIGEHEVYSTPHSPVNEEGYIPSTSVVMGMPTMHRSSTYAGVMMTGGAVAASSSVHTNNNRRWSLPEMSVGAYSSNPGVGHAEFLGNHM